MKNILKGLVYYTKVVYKGFRTYVTFKNIKRFVTVSLFIYTVSAFTFQTITITDYLGYTTIRKAEAEMTCPLTIDEFVNSKVAEVMKIGEVQKQIRSEVEFNTWRALQTRAEIAQSVLTN